MVSGSDVGLSAAKDLFVTRRSRSFAALRTTHQAIGTSTTSTRATSHTFGPQ